MELRDRKIIKNMQGNLAKYEDGVSPVGITNTAPDWNTNPNTYSSNGSVQMHTINGISPVGITDRLSAEAISANPSVTGSSRAGRL